VALRELGRIERTLFTLEWLKSMDLRRRANAGLNKGEARKALARATFFYRLGEMRDRSFESQAYHASGLNLLVAAIILWNTIYLERALPSCAARVASCDRNLQNMYPLGWEHIGANWRLRLEQRRFTGRWIVSAAAAQGINAPRLSCLFVLTSRTICALSCRHPQKETRHDPQAPSNHLAMKQLPPSPFSRSQSVAASALDRPTTRSR
jgi:hypothetical protein